MGQHTYRHQQQQVEEASLHHHISSSSPQLQVQVDVAVEVDHPCHQLGSTLQCHHQKRQRTLPRTIQQWQHQAQDTQGTTPQQRQQQCMHELGAANTSLAVEIGLGLGLLPPASLDLAVVFKW